MSMAHAQNRLQPLTAIGRARCLQVKAVVCDIDDTLTTDGKLSAEAYSALAALHESGFLVIPVTGRPAGWCDLIARFWPVDAVVGENGAFYFRYDHERHRMRRHLAAPLKEFRDRRARLDALASEILSAVPGAALASDQAYRLADLAIDFREDVPPLPAEKVDAIVTLFQKAGATAKVSSIHVNGWFGTYDKLSMTRELLAREFGIDAHTSSGAILFVGDSPNDEPMFRAFPLSVGVANVRDVMDRLHHLPAFVTHQPSGAGFVELANYLLAAKRGTR
jgi:HAD superfamily hydrolase (TIGR01484 family)